MRESPPLIPTYALKRIIWYCSPACNGRGWWGLGLGLQPPASRFLEVPPPFLSLCMAIALLWPCFWQTHNVEIKRKESPSGAAGKEQTVFYRSSLSLFFFADEDNQVESLRVDTPQQLWPFSPCLGRRRRRRRLTHTHTHERDADPKTAKKMVN